MGCGILCVRFPSPQRGADAFEQALFGMQDDKTKWSLTTPLTPEQLAWWQERMRRTIYHVRETFPKARIVYRKLHRTDDSVVGTQYITNCTSLTLTIRSTLTLCFRSVRCSISIANSISRRLTFAFQASASAATSARGGSAIRRSSDIRYVALLHRGANF